MLTEIGGQIGWLASVMNFRFKQPVYFGETITCRFTITDIDEHLRASAEAVYFNQDGNLVLKEKKKGILPDVVERRILNDMVAGGDPTNKRE
jgi:acyl dehydratase